MKKLLLAIFACIFFAISITAQEVRIRKGAVTDSLPIPGKANETFALYTPSDYSTDREWPVAFVFDPKGRGAATANLFRKTAEEQQYLIVSSNINLKSRPIDSIINTATTLMKTVFNSFPADSEQVYAIGLGEGAQVASALPLFYKEMAGIMAIGNSFVNPKYIDKNNPYMFIGLAGKKDYMVYEIEDYIRFYDDLDFPTSVYYFDGKEDEWPENTVVSNAMTGFTLQAIRNGKRPGEEAFIQQLFDNEMNYVEQLRRTRKYYAAYEKLDRMQEKYEDFGFEETIEDRMKTIKRTDGFRSQRRDFRQATSYEKQQQAEYEYLLRSDIMTANFQNVGWWAYQIDELQKIKESANEARSNMAYRLHGYLDFLSKREFDAILKSKAPLDTKIFISVLRTAIRKDDPEAYFAIISLASLDGDNETALLYLEDLLKTGFSNMDELYSIDGTLGLRITPEFNELIKEYLGEARFPVEEPEEN